MTNKNFKNDYVKNSYFNILEIDANNFNELLDIYKKTEMEYAVKKHNLKQKEIRLWFDTDWKTEIGMERPSEKNKEKWIKQKLDHEQFLLDQLEVKMKHIKRMYDTALKHSFEALQ